VNEAGAQAVLSANKKNSLPVPFKLRARKKMAALEEKLAEAVLYVKSCRDSKDNNKKRLAWEDEAR